MKRRLLVVAATLVAVTVTWVVPAGADPSRNAFQLPIDCGSAGTFTVAVFSNAPWSPGLDMSSNSVVVPIRVAETGTFYPADGSDPVVVFSDQLEKNTPQNKAPKLECTFRDEFENVDGTFVVTGEVTVFMTPARG
jgi:hypothetical protein